MLHHDNKSTHSLLSIWEVLTKNNIPLISDLAPNVFPFSKLNSTLQEKVFQKVAEVIYSATRELNI
jgi:hypothetical protein